MAWEYNDNVLLRRKGDGADFFSLKLRELDKQEQDFRETIHLTSYAVPGRTDIYMFGYEPMRSGFGDRITFFSDHSTTLTEALRMLQRDLNRDVVVELMRDAFKTPGAGLYLRVLADHLLATLAPKSKVLTMLNVELERRQQARHAAFNQR